MFTGIIEEIGTVKSIVHGARSIRIQVGSAVVLEGLNLGDSIAVNGVCLTAAALPPDGFAADVMPETMRRTSLGRLRPGDKVNLERALRLGDRLGGHLVSGHIDGTGALARRVREDNAIILTIRSPASVLRGLVPQGSVALEGVSLTVVSVEEERFQVSLIPHTAAQTTLGSLPIGTALSIECDMIGKYVERLLSRTGKGMSLADLVEQGF